MKKTMTCAAPLRVKAALCCSIAILLSACGGSTDDTFHQQMLAETVEVSAPTGAGTPGAAVPATTHAAQEAVAPEASAHTAHTADSGATPHASTAHVAPEPVPASAPAPASHDVANAAPGSQGASAPASNEFNFTGYQFAPAASGAAGQDPHAAAGADAHPAPQPAA